eukprot:TRINITY_DN1520_c0_g1_i1.p1 TRINITY_DN1520_c0_g1~~TRINITY_DN1520_c0_g1_i1.p1  ORF type:complete len:113 (+),score=25.99 TRINITY_DN1520_c0_g1_i1:27-365(+)
MQISDNVTNTQFYHIPVEVQFGGDIDMKNHLTNNTRESKSKNNGFVTTFRGYRFRGNAIKDLNVYLCDKDNKVLKRNNSFLSFFYDQKSENLLKQDKEVVSLMNMLTEINMM